MAGCQCDVSRSGTNCETINGQSPSTLLSASQNPHSSLFPTVNVTCNTEDFVMEICYLPHEGYDFSQEDRAAMYADGKGGETACIGRLGTNFCQEGLVGLALPLATDQLKTCGTKFQFSSVSS